MKCFKNNYLAHLRSWDLLIEGMEEHILLGIKDPQNFMQVILLALFKLSLVNAQKGVSVPLTFRFNLTYFTCHIIECILFNEIKLYHVDSRAEMTLTFFAFLLFDIIKCIFLKDS